MWVFTKDTEKGIHRLTVTMHKKMAHIQNLSFKPSLNMQPDGKLKILDTF